MVSAAAQIDPKLVGPSMDIDDFARASGGGSGGVLQSLFATKPRVAVIFFVLGALLTFGLQAIFGSDDKLAQLGRDQLDASHATQAAAATAQAAKPADQAEAKAADKAESEPVPSAAPAASAEPVEPAAVDDEASAAKTTKSAPSAPAKFNKTAATKAMSAAASQASRCKSSGKGGPAKVTATFATSGKVSLVQVISGRFDSKTLACIRSAFQAAHVPAFTGKPEAVTKSFTVK
jgi:hypothetical protein